MSSLLPGSTKRPVIVPDAITGNDRASAITAVLTVYEYGLWK